MIFLTSDGKIGLKNGKLAIAGPGGTDCCCPVAGCCQGTLIPTQMDVENPSITIPGTVLELEVLFDSVGCFPVGSTQELNDLTANSIWSTNDPFLGNPAWRDLHLSCGPNDTLVLQWANMAGCPLTDTSPLGDWIWTRTAGQCDPIDFTFEFIIDEDDFTGCSACNGAIGGVGLSGTVRIRIREAP